MYTADEIDLIKLDIQAVGDTASVAGIVVGVLDGQGNVNVPVMTGLVELARIHGMSATFHRAFDDVEDVEKALEEVISTGCDKILTSGGG
jgi:copper homeostasis protein